jgi:hypothetical protein
MINNIAIYTDKSASEHHRKTLELCQFLKKYSSIQVKLDPNIRTLQNANVFVSGYRREFLDLDSSNKLIFLCRNGSISAKQWLLIPSVDVVVTNTYYEGLHVSWQLQAKGFNTRVVHLLPWSAPKKIDGEGVYCHAMDNKYRKAFWGKKLQNDNPQAPIRAHLSEKDKVWPYAVVEGMLSGAIIIAPDRPPYNELIIDRHNGFLIRTPGDIVGALQEIEKNEHWISHNARSSTHAKLNPTRYLSSLMNLEELPEIKITPTPIEYSKRRWLVRERVFQDGKIKYHPEIHGPNFTVIDLNEIQEVLSYFLTQDFSEVYIFGCDIPEEVEKRELNHLMRLIHKMGPRSMRIHFCRDDPIPDVWGKIFTRLSIISVEEGLKQVLS